MDEITLQPGESVTIRAATAQTPPPASDGPSGIAVPSVKAGWTRAGFSHFDDDIPLGQWDGDLQGALVGRDAGDDTSDRGFYSNERCMSQHDSVLDAKLFQDSTGKRWMGCPLNKAGSNNNTGTLNLRVTECMKVDGPQEGWKMAHMIAKYGAVRSQEFDYPEVQFKTSGDANAWLHAMGTDTHFTFPVSMLYEWHTYTIERVAGKHVIIELDGEELGRITQNVTQDKVHWIGQNETWSNKAQAIPVKMGEAHVLTDWITIDVQS